MERRSRLAWWETWQDSRLTLLEPLRSRRMGPPLNTCLGPGDRQGKGGFQSCALIPPFPLTCPQGEPPPPRLYLHLRPVLSAIPKLDYYVSAPGGPIHMF